MAESILGSTIYLLPGMSVQITSPVTSRNYGGYFVATEIPHGFGTDLSKIGAILRGFVVENTDVGDIKASSESSASVVYTHRKHYENAIWFFAYSGERGVVKVISVPIHDHSSIISGGPSLGTYFSDDSEA